MSNARSLANRATDWVSVKDFPSVQAAIDSGYKSLFVDQIFTLTGTVYYIKTDNAGARTQSTDIMT